MSSAITPLESESYLLASVLKNPSLWAQVRLIPEEQFGLPEHRAIYRHMAGIFDAGLEIAIPTLKDRITQDPQALKDFEDVEGGTGYLDYLTTQVPVVESAFRSYLDPLRRNVQFDRVKDLAMDALEKANSGKDDPDDIALWMGREAFGPKVRFHVVEEDISVGALIKRDYTGRFAELENPSTEEQGIRTGYEQLDKILLGMRAGQMITVGARPGVGKTAFALNLALRTARQYGPVLFFSLEMGYIELARRLFCMVSQVNHQEFMEGTLDAEEASNLRRAIGIVSRLPIDIVDTSGLDIADVMATIQERDNQGKQYSLIIVDYIQLIGSKGRQDDRVSIMTRISKSMKHIARQYDVPVLALSQLSRSPEKRPNKKPLLSDLRDSGSIEQDSDAVLFLYRPSMNKEKKEGQVDEEEMIAEVIVEKQRSGKTGVAKLVYRGECFRFEDLEVVHV